MVSQFTERGHETLRPDAGLKAGSTWLMADFYVWLPLGRGFTEDI